jgi:hypothetical protein
MREEDEKIGKVRRRGREYWNIKEGRDWKID